MAASIVSDALWNKFWEKNPGIKIQTNKMLPNALKPKVVTAKVGGQLALFVGFGECNILVAGLGKQQRRTVQCSTA